MSRLIRYSAVCPAVVFFACGQDDVSFDNNGTSQSALECGGLAAATCEQSFECKVDGSQCVPLDCTALSKPQCFTLMSKCVWGAGMCVANCASLDSNTCQAHPTKCTVAGTECSPVNVPLPDAAADSSDGSVQPHPEGGPGSGGAPGSGGSTSSGGSAGSGGSTSAAGSAGSGGSSGSGGSTSAGGSGGSPSTCQDGDKKCMGQTLYVCQQQSWIMQESCSLGCSSQAACGQCEGGQHRCESNDLEICAEDRKSFVFEKKCDYQCFDTTRCASPGEEIWSRGSYDGCDSSPAVAPDGTIYIGCNDGDFYAFDAHRELKWQFTAEGAIKSSPAIADDGTIYFGSDDKRVYAIRPDGGKLWTYILGDKVESSPAIGNDGTIYIGSNANELVALSTDGHLKWRFATGGAVDSSPAVTPDGLIVFTSEDGYFYALKATGEKAWSFSAGAGKSSPAVDKDGSFVFGTNGGRVYSLTATGSVKWLYKPSVTYPIESSPSIGEDGSVYVGGIWLNSVAGVVIAIDSTGHEKWRMNTSAEIYASPALGADGMVYVGSSWGTFYGIDPTNAHPWSIDAGSVSSPTIVSDGTIYLGGTSEMHAFVGSSSLANSPWPKFRGNLRNTGNPIHSGGNVTCYDDKDADMFGDKNASQQFPGTACPSGTTPDSTDCDDTNNKVHPNQTEYFSSGYGSGSLNFDYDCSGTVETKADGGQTDCRHDGDCEYGEKGIYASPDKCGKQIFVYYCSTYSTNGNPWCEIDTSHSTGAKTWISCH